jgi:hypothetical protein
MKQLILLAGLHKTATTSIQQTCAANQGALFRAGFAYPVMADPKEQAASNNTRFLNWFRQDPAKMGLQGQFKWTQADLGSRDQWLAQLATELEKLPNNLLMAGEGVSLFSADELSDMKGWFAQHGWEIRLVCHVRHLSSWIHSMIAQRVTSPVRLSIPQAIEEYRRYGSIVRHRIETMKQVFPKSEFYSHEQAVQHASGPVGFFFDKVGIKPSGPVRFVRANEGSGDCTTRVLSLINEKFGRFDAAGELNREFFGNPRFIDAVKAIAGPKFRLRPAEVAPILPLLEADNEWLKSNLGPQFHDPRIEFANASIEWTTEGLAQFERILAAVPPPVRDWVHVNRQRLDLPSP